MNKTVSSICTRRWRTNRGELAGALAEMKSHSAKDYPDLDIAKMQNLIQSGDRILNTMSEKSSQAEEFLTSLGVKSGKMFV
jgi:NADH dehydrogenase